ncbi:hypothetical protein POM88_029396 [Heracleum sosnowskyi]|uniref:Uncharacterized protein n=1 Tax=Heracleum sosnowskyi TaxID=360622 RepID=A0AAD8MIF6_9APIA|nr:hypothetical protein POM88_029396 [Heracleum sosnowskyi]
MLLLFYVFHFISCILVYVLIVCDLTKLLGIGGQFSNTIVLSVFNSVDVTVIVGWLVWQVMYLVYDLFDPDDTRLKASSTYQDQQEMDQPLSLSLQNLRKSNFSIRNGTKFFEKGKLISTYTYQMEWK